MQLKQYKKAQQYFEQLQEDLPSFLLYNHCTVPSKLLLSSLEFHHFNDNQNKMLEEYSLIKEKYTPEIADNPGFIMYSLYMAACAFYEEKYHESTTVLNNVLNQIGFKNYPHGEIEVKLLLALAYLKENKFDQAESVIRSVSRKIKEMNENGEYENAATFVKILKVIYSNSGTKIADKIKKLVFSFNQLNKVSLPIMNFIKTDESFIQNLIKTL